MEKFYPEDLALFGGKSAFEKKLHVGRPNIGNRKRFLTRINDILDRKWLTNAGPYVKEFEQRLADYLEVKHCVAMCNATVALEVVIRALDLDGEVIIPSFTHVATAHALQWQKVTPIFCDIDPKTYNIDPSKLKQIITPRTTGIIGVHIYGRPCNVGLLSDIANNHDLKLVFDAAHAFGCSYKGQMIGNFGEAEVFSFHATKFFNTFEGGAVVTNNDDLADKIRLMKNFGFSGHNRKRCLGINGKMSEVSAAMGLTGFESLNDFISSNYSNYKVYRSQLENIPGVRLITYEEEEKRNYQYIILEVDEKVTKLSCEQFVNILQAENILARRYFYPTCHQIEPYRSNYSGTELDLPETERVAERVIALPTGTAVSCDEVKVVCAIIRSIISHSQDLLPLFVEKMERKAKFE